HHAFSSGAGRTSDGNGSHASTLKSPSYTKSVSWQHYLNNSSKTSTVQIKRIKPSIIYRLLLIGLGSPMVIYGLVRPLTIETRD
ncbi:hypothetical protein, partial [Escherichia coli]|uniref:hypothetical protein n=1 Tax=Escherichia coli TaxID=562 RepID=UPI003A4E3557